MNLKELGNPYDVQVGGNHYVSLKYQPAQLSKNVDFNGIQLLILRYVSRKKNGVEDLQKAAHLARIGAWDCPINHYDPIKSEAEITRYIIENELHGERAQIIHQIALQDWENVYANIQKLINN